MPKTFRPYDPDQILLLPPSVNEWVPEGDLAHFIGDLVDELDLSAILDEYETGDLRGYPPYHPRMMTKLWLYAYATGQRSSRKLAQLAIRDVGCMMLAAGNRPDFRTLNSFRLRHLGALEGLFGQVLEMCREEGLVRLDHVAILKGRETGTRAVTKLALKEAIELALTRGAAVKARETGTGPVPKLALRSDTIWHWPNSPNCLACRPR